MPICNRVARIRRKPLSGDPPPVALTLTGATNRLPNRSPDKVQAAIRESSPGGAYAYRGYQPTTEP
ncbi:hypothetical protein [Klebsiella aerogenes]|uniref:hypothetical protein n=1 Tax=Klebsiella aerogenes TaxID=548 RepID=UPI003680FDD5